MTLSSLLLDEGRLVGTAATFAVELAS